MTHETDGFLNAGAAPFLSKMRKGMFWGGVVMILLGIAAIMMPFFTSLVVEIMIGWLLTISGGLAVIGAFSLRGTGVFAWELVAGLITLGGGLLMLFFPIEGLMALTALIALIMVLTGVAQGAFALWVRPMSGWVWGGLSAVISIVLGVYIFWALPDASAVILGLLVGIDFVSTGTALVLIVRTGASLD